MGTLGKRAFVRGSLGLDCVSKGPNLTRLLRKASAFPASERLSGADRRSEAGAFSIVGARTSLNLGRRRSSQKIAGRCRMLCFGLWQTPVILLSFIEGKEWHLTCACNTLTLAGPASICAVQAKGARHCDPMNGDEAQRLHSLASPRVQVVSLTRTYTSDKLRHYPMGGSCRCNFILTIACPSSASGLWPFTPNNPSLGVQANAHVAAVAISETRRSVQRTWRLMSTPRVSLHPLGVSESCSEPVQERCGCGCAWVATSAA